MKKRLSIYLTAIISTFLFTNVFAQTTILDEKIIVEQAEVIKQANKMSVTILLDLSNLTVKPNSLYTLSPIIQSGLHESRLPVIQIVGRQKNIYLKRKKKKMAAVNLWERILRKNNTTQVIKYTTEIAHEEWMNHSHLILNEDKCNCGLESFAENQTKIHYINLAPIPFKPALAYIRPEVEEIKRRNITESAYLEYKVNMTNIDAGFRKNQEELDKINKFISEAREDKNITIQNILIHGYASPDGLYNTNAQLSKKRSRSMMNYVKTQYGLNEKDINMQSTAEDWNGLRNRITESDLKHKEEILKIIDSDNAEDPKEQLIKKEYPDDYKYILENIYPFLRRSDCEVDFIARNFNLEEAKEIIKTNPVQLSLNEMYLIAKTYATGSEEFNEIFELAARMFPKDSVANLNIANSLLIKGDIIQAKSFLTKSPDCPETNNAKGVVAMLEENFDLALTLLEKAKEAGIVEAEENIRQIHIRQGVIEINFDKVPKEKTE